jgi:hypothetical protein
MLESSRKSNTTMPIALFHFLVRLWLPFSTLYNAAYKDMLFC